MKNTASDCHALPLWCFGLCDPMSGHGFRFGDKATVNSRVRGAKDAPRRATDQGARISAVRRTEATAEPAAYRPRARGEEKTRTAT
jgi:hypothetical protein